MIINHRTEKSKEEFGEKDEGQIIDFPSEKSGNYFKFLEKIERFYWALFIFAIALVFLALFRLLYFREKTIPVKIYSSVSVYEESRNNSGLNKNSETATAILSLEKTSITTSSERNAGEVIGSKNSKKYYFPWCGTVNRIKPENQIIFASVEKARLVGYLPGGNCKGLK